jgi:L-ascorbate metabolism protein UlaG (beta-lactamase superfamily)
MFMTGGSVMRSRLVVTVVSCVLAGLVIQAQRPAPDVLPASGGDITIIPITHGTLQIEHGAHVILIDPARFGPGSTMPPPPPPPPPGKGGAPQGGADPNSTPATAAQMSLFKGLKPPTIILITDIHEDHLDKGAIVAVQKPNMTIVAPAAASAQMKGAVTMANGETKTIDGVTIEAVPMYNTQPDPQFKQIFHTKGRGNGYVVTLGGKRLYIAGDTACTPEMKALKNIDVAFLPMNLPYTMAPPEAVECAKAFKPAIVYPYHYFGQDPNVFASALKGSGIDVRLRDWYHGVKPPR